MTYQMTSITGSLPSSHARCLESFPGEHPDDFWRPILNLQTPLHPWVERFFWQWFTDGSTSGRKPCGLYGDLEADDQPRLGKCLMGPNS